MNNKISLNVHVKVHITYFVQFHGKWHSLHESQQHMPVYNLRRTTYSNQTL